MGVHDQVLEWERKTMRRLTLAVGSFALLMSSIEPVLAENNSWYAGLNIGTTAVGITCPTAPCDDSDMGWRIFGGYQFSKIWGVKAAYLDLGDVKSGSSTIEFDGFDILGTATWNIDDRWSIFGELGFYSLNADIKGGQSTDGTGQTLGFGGALHANDRIAVRLEYQLWFDVGKKGVTNESDIELYSVGFVYSF